MHNTVVLFIRQALNKPKPSTAIWYLCLLREQFLPRRPMKIMGAQRYKIQFRTSPNIKKSKVIVHCSDRITFGLRRLDWISRLILKYKSYHWIHTISKSLTSHGVSSKSVLKMTRLWQLTPFLWDKWTLHIVSWNVRTFF